MRTSVMKTILLLSLFTGLFAGTLACSQEQAGPVYECRRIVTGPGPEDMVLDTLHGKERLLISCTARREGQEAYGEIESIDLENPGRKVLVRLNEPDSLLFRPHGIHLLDDRLYVISHEREPDLHPILVYSVRGDTLLFREMINSGKQHSPNALVAGKDGDIYFVNDSGRRGSLLEKALKLKRASIVRLRKDENGKWESEYMAIDLGYPAGINRRGNRLFAGDAVLHRIHCYRITPAGLTEEPPLKGLRGNDNLRLHGASILTCGHVKPFRFVAHARKTGKLSPVEVFLADPANGGVESLFRTDGSLISGGSTAIIHGNKLYISQVFEPYILEVSLP